MLGKRRLEDAPKAESDRIKLLKERVRAGNLPFHDPLVDGKLTEYRRALSQHYRGFEVR
jgi:hypothetical protein